MLAVNAAEKNRLPGDPFRELCVGSAIELFQRDRLAGSDVDRLKHLRRCPTSEGPHDFVIADARGLESHDASVTR